VLKWKQLNPFLSHIWRRNRLTLLPWTCTFCSADVLSLTALLECLYFYFLWSLYDCPAFRVLWHNFVPTLRGFVTLNFHTLTSKLVHYTVSQKIYHRVFVIILPNIDRFSKVFHWRTLWKVIVKYLTTSETHFYTTLWNINIRKLAKWLAYAVYHIISHHLFAQKWN